MPTMRGKDTKGCYYKYGDTGKKYYYTCGNKISRETAKKKAAKQGRAIEYKKAEREKEGK